jgi:hypothetical protein
MWHKSTPHAAPAPQPPTSPSFATAAPPTHVAKSATSSEPVRASSSKTIWIAVAAVVALALVVIAVVLLRGGGNSQSAVNSPSAPNSPNGANPPSNPPPATNPPAGNPPPASNPVAPIAKPAQPPASPAVADPIVGCYQWFNNAPVVIRTDGTMIGGPFTARWRAVNAAARAYTFTWPEATDTVTITPDHRSLSGANQYGFPTSGTRIAGTVGLIGIWRWPNGVSVTVYPDGAFTAATFRGKWQAIDAARGIYSLTW